MPPQSVGTVDAADARAGAQSPSSDCPERPALDRSPSQPGGQTQLHEFMGSSVGQGALVAGILTHGMFRLGLAKLLAKTGEAKHAE